MCIYSGSNIVLCQPPQILSLRNAVCYENLVCRDAFPLAMTIIDTRKSGVDNHCCGSTSGTGLSIIFTVQSSARLGQGGQVRVHMSHDVAAAMIKGWRRPPTIAPTSPSYLLTTSTDGHRVVRIFDAGLHHTALVTFTLLTTPSDALPCSND